MNSANPSLADATFRDFEATADQNSLAILADLSLLDSFTDEEASKVVSYPDISRKLKVLLKEGILILVSEAPNRFQINSLMREAFRNRLAENTSKFQSAARKSAKVLEEKHPLKALELYGLAGDVSKATPLITSNIERFLYQADLELTMKWSSIVSMALGGGIWREKLVRAFGFFAAGKFTQLRTLIRDLEGNPPSGEEGKVLVSELKQLDTFINFIFGNFENMSDEILDKVLTSEEKAGSTRSFRLYYLRSFLVSSFYTQNLALFQNREQKLTKYLPNHPNPMENILINSIKAMNCFLVGNYIEANEFALASVNLAEELGVEGTFFPYESAFILMDTFLEFGEEEKSQFYVDLYLPLAIKYHQYPWIAAFYSKAAVITSQAGNIGGALNMIRKGRDAIDSPLFAKYLWFHLDGVELLLRMALGDTNRAQELMYRLDDHKVIQSLKISMQIMRNPNETAHLASKMPEETILDQFRKELLLANAYVNNSFRVSKHLKNAIEIAESNGYFNAFLLMSSQLKSRIVEIAAEQPTNYLENLVRAIQAQSIVAARNSIGPSQPLTKSELKILRRLLTGLPIAQIASELSISKNTIKTHLKNLYRKLEVGSRHEATEKAKELALF